MTIVVAVLALAGAAVAGVVAGTGGSKAATIRVTKREYTISVSTGDTTTGSGVPWG
jgi:hypothetical protein